MIPSLYDNFKHWASTGSVWLVSDTHFDDPDCSLMDPAWPDPAEHVKAIKRCCGKNDTLVHLGDVGDPAYLDRLRCRKVLVRGNHDTPKAVIDEHFDEVYDGPILIAPKIMLSHEPVFGLSWCANIHGHDHADAVHDEYHVNLAANVVGYVPTNLATLIKHGLTSDIEDIHKQTVRRAAERKAAKEADADAAGPKTVYFVIGPPHAGKTTAIEADEHLASLPRVDLFDAQLPYKSKNTYGIANTWKSYYLVLIRLLSAMEKNNEVVFEHTLVKAQRRPLYIDAVRNCFPDAKIVCCYVYPEPDEMITRSGIKPALVFGKGKDREKAEKLARIIYEKQREVVLGNLEMFDVPTLDEGFDEIRKLG